jgi:uncharacterized protein (TIGR02147 family)
VTNKFIKNSEKAKSSQRKDLIKDLIKDPIKNLSKSPIVAPEKIDIQPPNLFKYQNYRLFIKDFISFKRAQDKNFNMKKLAQILGFSSHAGLAMILSDQRELRPPYLDNCIKYFKFDINQRLYFEAMVRAGTLSPTKSKNLLREVQFLNQTWTPPSMDEGVRLLDYGLTHQILCLHKRFLTISEIQSYFRYNIDTKKLKQILDFMLERNQVIKSNESEYPHYKIQTDVLLTTDEAPNAPAKQMHSDALNLAINALNDDISTREFQTYIFTVNSKDIPSLKQKIKQIVRQAISEFESDLDADTAVQLHFNMFEPIKPLRPRQEKEKI